MSSFWFVSKAYPFSAIKVGDSCVVTPPEDPQWFLPVFGSREAAVAWLGGESAEIHEVFTEERKDG